MYVWMLLMFVSVCLSACIGFIGFLHTQSHNWAIVHTTSCSISILLLAQRATLKDKLDPSSLSVAKNEWNIRSNNTASNPTSDRFFLSLFLLLWPLLLPFFFKTKIVSTITHQSGTFLYDGRLTEILTVYFFQSFFFYKMMMTKSLTAQQQQQ